MKHAATAALALATLCHASSALEAETWSHHRAFEASTWAPPFAFAMPWDDGAPTFVDASFLNASPAGKDGFIAARGGHFAHANTNRRVRFMGVNLTFDTAFPDKADAPKMAARLAKAGFNVVRFHYIDGSYYGRNSLWERGEARLSRDRPGAT
jgi:hypothetical protein